MLAKPYLLIFLLHFVGVTIGVDVKAKVTPRIVNGTAIDIEEVPWQGSLHVLLIGDEPTVAFLQQICGTVLIGHKWALTAAHCTVDQKANALLVRFGSAMLYRGGVLNEITRIIQHEQFNPFTMDYDFSLLELTNLMMFTQHIRPVSLPKIMDDFPAGTSAFVSGWGETRNLSQQQFNLRGATIPLYNHTKCIEAYKVTNDVTPRMICAGFEQGGKDACNGDSGGPLVVRRRFLFIPRTILVGLVSWGSGCAEPHYPGVYSNVQSAREWILQHSGL